MPKKSKQANNLTKTKTPPTNPNQPTNQTNTPKAQTKNRTKQTNKNKQTNKRKNTNLNQCLNLKNNNETQYKTPGPQKKMFSHLEIPKP